MAMQTSGKYLLRNVYLLSAVSAITCAALTALFSWRHLQQHQDEAHATTHHVAALRLIAGIQAKLLHSNWHARIDDVESDVARLKAELSTDSADANPSTLVDSWRTLREKQQATDSEVNRSDETFQLFVNQLDRLRSRLAVQIAPAVHGHIGTSGSKAHFFLGGLILACGAWGVAWLLFAIVRSQRALEDAHASLEQRVNDRTAELADRNARLYDEVELRRELEQEILTIASEEQLRIAAHLHDDLGQRLTGLALGAKTLERQLSDDTRGHSAAELTRQATATSTALRNIVRGLYPSKMNREELALAIDALAADTNARTGCRINADLSETPILPDTTVNVQIYGIVREAVNNAVRHGEAKNIDIRLASTEGLIALSVSDDGKGFEMTDAPEHDGVGLQLMRYRADILRGLLAIDTSPGGGTRVNVQFPLRSEG